jgi:hypothetical protein
MAGGNRYCAHGKHGTCLVDLYLSICGSGAGDSAAKWVVVCEGGDWRPLPDGRDGYEVVEFAPRRRKERRAEGGEPDSRKVAPRRREERRAGGGDRWRDSLPLRERQLAREG